MRVANTKLILVAAALVASSPAAFAQNAMSNGAVATGGKGTPPRDGSMSNNGPAVGRSDSMGSGKMTGNGTNAPVANQISKSTGSGNGK